MDKHARYILALGAFRQQVAMLVASAKVLDGAAREYDPDGTAPDDPIALQLFNECAAELRMMCMSLSGMRQLLIAALGKE